MLSSSKARNKMLRVRLKKNRKKLAHWKSRRGRKHLTSKRQGKKNHRIEKNPSQKNHPIRKSQKQKSLLIGKIRKQIRSPGKNQAIAKLVRPIWVRKIRMKKGADLFQKGGMEKTLMKVKAQWRKSQARKKQLLRKKRVSNYHRTEKHPRKLLSKKSRKCRRLWKTWLPCRNKWQPLSKCLKISNPTPTPPKSCNRKWWNWEEISSSPRKTLSSWLSSRPTAPLATLMLLSRPRTNTREPNSSK